MLPNNFFPSMFVKVCYNMYLFVETQLPWETLLICINPRCSTSIHESALWKIVAYLQMIQGFTADINSYHSTSHVLMRAQFVLLSRCVKQIDPKMSAFFSFAEVSLVIVIAIAVGIGIIVLAIGLICMKGWVIMLLYEPPKTNSYVSFNSNY